MALPETITVTLHRTLGIAPRCICEEQTSFKNPATVRVIWTAESVGQAVFPDWEGAESRCPDGADSLVQTIREQARPYGIRVEVKDKTEGIYQPGELD